MMASKLNILLVKNLGVDSDRIEPIKSDLTVRHFQVPTICTPHTKTDHVYVLSVNTSRVRNTGVLPLVCARPFSCAWLSWTRVRTEHHP